jgi:hypothetical protein
MRFSLRKLAFSGAFLLVASALYRQNFILNGMFLNSLEDEEFSESIDTIKVTEKLYTTTAELDSQERPLLKYLGPKSTLKVIILSINPR